MPAELRPYQQEARAAIAGCVALGKRALVTVLPTGTGKTVLFSAEVAERTAGGGRALILAHRDELIEQPRVALERAAPGLEVGVCKADRNEIGSRVVIASVQSISQQKRLDAYRGFGVPSLVVTDECHHAVASTYRKIYEALGAGQQDGPLHLGYTATPQRTDKIGLSEVFEEVAFHRDIRQMVTEGWLAEPRGRIVAVDIDLEHVRRNDSGDYSDSGLDEAYDEAAIDGIAKAWIENACPRVTVAFTPSVRTAEMLAEAVNRRAGAEIAAEVDGETPTLRRREVLSALKSGHLKLVANCGVLTEGFDAPNVACIVVARPTKSEGLYTQMVGRGLRLWPGKSDCLVLDVTGISAQHSLCVLPMLFGLPVEDMDGKTVSEVAAELAEEARRQGLRLAALEEQVDLLRRRRHWAWVEVRQGVAYSVGIGRDGDGLDVMVVVRATADGEGSPWEAEVRRYGGRHLAARETLCTADGDRGAEDAFGAAETWLAAQPQACLLAAAGDGSWRTRSGEAPATEAQIRALKNWKVPVPPGCTKAQASDLLGRAIASARLVGA